LGLVKYAKTQEGKMAKRCLPIGFIVTFIVVISLAGIIGCGTSSVAGTYVNQDNPSEYLELKKDGTFYSHEMGIVLTGEWELDGDKIIFKLPIGIALTGTIKGDTITSDVKDPFTGKAIIYKKGKPSK
jgi:hypothetical protein